MRAWLDVLEDKELPSNQLADANGEVAALGNVSLKF